MAEFEVKNRVIKSLRPAAQEFFAKRAHTRQTFAGETIYEEGAPFTHAIFPHSGLISLMAEMDDGRTVEKVAIGPEGFVGFILLMGGGNAISKSVVRIPGYASWLSLEDLDEALEDFQCVRGVMLHYAQSLITQLMEKVACNSLHSAEQRVVGWLLHAHDSVHRADIRTTQRAIADVLGLRRATVSEICSHLQADKVLDYGRGEVSVLNRDEMENRACECYRRLRAASIL